MAKKPQSQEKPDFSALMCGIQYLDECLRRGVVVGIYEDSKAVSDEDIDKALKNVMAKIADLRREMEIASRMYRRYTGVELIH